MSYVKYTTRNYETLKKLSDIILDQRSLKKKECMLTTMRVY